MSTLLNNFREKTQRAGLVRPTPFRLRNVCARVCKSAAHFPLAGFAPRRRRKVAAARGVTRCMRDPRRAARRLRETTRSGRRPPTRIPVPL